MGVCIGADWHVRTQTVCWMDTTDDELHERTLENARDDVGDFYAQLASPAVLGVEASGYSLWFHRLIEQAGHRLLAGNASAIRQFARRRQKNEQRDAQLLLDLFVHGDFPSVAAARKLVLRLYRMLREEIDYAEFRRRGRDARLARVGHCSVARQVRQTDGAVRPSPAPETRGEREAVLMSQRSMRDRDPGHSGC